MLDQDRRGDIAELGPVAGHDLADLARTPAGHDAHIQPLGREPALVLGQPRTHVVAREPVPIEEHVDLLHSLRAGPLGKGERKGNNNQCGDEAPPRGLYDTC